MLIIVFLIFKWLGVLSRLSRMFSFSQKQTILFRHYNFAYTELKDEASTCTEPSPVTPKNRQKLITHTHHHHHHHFVFSWHELVLMLCQGEKIFILCLQCEWITKRKVTFEFDGDCCINEFDSDVFYKWIWWRLFYECIWWRECFINVSCVFPKVIYYDHKIQYYIWIIFKGINKVQAN